MFVKIESLMRNLLLMGLLSFQVILVKSALKSRVQLLNYALEMPVSIVQTLPKARFDIR